MKPVDENLFTKKVPAGLLKPPQVLNLSRLIKTDGVARPERSHYRVGNLSRDIESDGAAGPERPRSWMGNLSHVIESDDEIMQRGTAPWGNTGYTNKRLILSHDLSQVYGIVGPRYRVVPHEKVINVVSESLEAGPVNCLSLRKGAAMRALWEVPGRDSVEIVTGDIIRAVLDVRNSVDGRSCFSIGLAAIRCVCNNGMVLGSKLLGFRVPHFESTLTERRLNEMVAACNGEAIQRISDTLKEWRTIRVTEKQIDKLAELVTLGTQRRERIGDMAGSSLYDVYNEFTYQATHNSKTPNAAFELSNRIGRVFFNPDNPVKKRLKSVGG